MAGRRKKNVEYRRKNYTGSVTEVNRPDIRNKFMARVTTGHKINKDGKRVQIRKTIGYYETQELAERALINYIEEMERTGRVASKGNKQTLQEIWDKFIADKALQNLSQKRMDAFEYDLIHIPPEIMQLTFEQTNFDLWNKTLNEIKKKVGYSTLKRIRGDFMGLYKYAEKYDVTVKNFPEQYDLGPSLKKGKTLIFSKRQIEELWALHFKMQGNKEARFAVDTVLMLIYNGCRIEEFLSLKSEDVHLSEKYIDITKSKTKAGVRRVPIHAAVEHIYQEYYDGKQTYFLELNRKKVTYANYRDSYWDRLRDELKWSEHMTPHNCRKTFSSLMRYYSLDVTCQKLILGHEGKLDLQEKTYTVVPTSKLVEEINKIPKSAKDLVNLVDEVADVENIDE